APTNPPVEAKADADDFGGELLKAPRVSGAALVTISPEDMEEEPQVVSPTNRQVSFRVGERDVLPDSESSPARVAVPREGGGVAITARTTRISQPRSPSAAASEEVIITGEGGDQDRSDDGTLKISLEPVSHGDIKVPELTDDEEGEPPELVPQPIAGPPPVDATQIKALLAEAKAAHERGDLHRAIQLLSDALEMDPDRADAYINRGHSHLDLGDYSSAMSDFQRAEDLEPKKAEPHFAMGNLYFNRKEYKRAIEFYDHALELDGSHAMARCRRGISHYYRKTYRQAVQDLQAAFRLDPEIPNIKKYVQMAMKKLDRPD
ncbi:MAG TPA: tetratricopeptide repeat protein, partial [Myxococcota bacterium]|nr:tetratricopeptide repeat protein [Myxococcota bacterium]